MLNQFSRTELLVGTEGMQRLQRSRVAIFGIGGVGGHVVEALARSGVGALDLIDRDKVELTNLNRQIIATHSTLGQSKVETARRRILDINPKAVVRTYEMFYLPETAGTFDFAQYDYVVDAIDTVAGKLQLAEQAVAAKIPIISAMGAGNKMDASALEVADLSQTSVCPLARVMRRELKKRGIEHLKVVYSKEKPLPLRDTDTRTEEGAHRLPTGSNAFVPAVAGLIIAGEVVKDLIQRPLFSMSGSSLMDGDSWQNV